MFCSLLFHIIFFQAEKKKLLATQQKEVEEQELYLGDFLVRTEFFTKESYDRLILMEAKIGVMTEVMMSLRDVIYASMDLDKHIDEAN